MDRHHIVQVSEIPYGIGRKSEYDMKPENELKHEHGYDHEMTICHKRENVAMNASIIT